MLRIFLRSAFAVALCVAFSSLVSATPFSYSFQDIINPGDPNFTQALGINNSSVIAGYYGDGSIIANHGFTLVLPSSYTPENFPVGVQTQVIGINNTGWTDGFYTEASGVTEGFTFNGTTYSRVAAPGTKFNQLLAINDSLTAAGYSSLDPTGMTLQRAYTEKGGVFTYVTSFLPSGILNSQAVGINNTGTVSGFYEDAAGVFHGYILSPTDVLTILNFPAAMDTSAAGINNLGEVVGFYVDSMGAMHGFTYNAGVYTTVDDPSGVGTTTINGINDKGQLVGFYVNGADNTIGFIANPVSTVPEPGSMILLGSGLLAGAVFLRRKLW
jgi:PEP-CTERM motif